MQVALKVESVESALVPNSLEMANTASEILSLHYTCIIVFDPFTSYNVFSLIPLQGCGNLMNIGKADPTRPMFAHSMLVYYART